MIKVQRALLEDLPKFASMEQAEGTREYIIPFSLEEHENCFAEPSAVYLRILDDEELVGFFILGLDDDGDSVEFRRIVVSSKGEGIGQEAVKRMERFCRTDLSRSRVWLDVFANNNRGRHVYEKLDYVQFGSAEHERAPLLLFEKNL